LELLLMLLNMAGKEPGVSLVGVRALCGVLFMRRADRGGSGASTGEDREADRSRVREGGEAEEEEDSLAGEGSLVLVWTEGV
jgi:hypothetical protein